MRVPVEMSDGSVSLRPYDPADSEGLFESLADERVWEHMSRPAPTDARELDAVIRSKLEGANRRTFTIRKGGRLTGITSVLFDSREAEGVEIGGTLLDPVVWGTGVNPEAKRLLLALVFENGAAWVQFRSDERNLRSAAAIRKLGAADLGIRKDNLVRRDGTLRFSRIFRIGRPR